jgi:CheY-like chemotaxis protein
VSGSPRRLLIADDEPHVRELLRDFLTGQGYEVATVATGSQALDTVPTFQPDVILVDMLMPGMSGRDVLDAVRQRGVTVPVILISGNRVPTFEGFFGVLIKPFDLRRLAEVVAAAAAGSSRPQPS